MVEARKHIKNAAEAHTRLNTFYSAIEILEGTLPGGSEDANRACLKIIKECKRAAGEQLKLYDKEVAAALRALKGDDRG